MSWLLKLAFWGGIIALIVLGFVVGPHVFAFIGLGFLGVSLLSFLCSSGSSSRRYVSKDTYFGLYGGSKKPEQEQVVRSTVVPPSTPASASVSVAERSLPGLPYRPS